MRVVQVLDLAENENQQEKGEEVNGESPVEASTEKADDNTEGQCVGRMSEEPDMDRSQQICHESSPKSSRWDDVSNNSDEGTPERDLPGTSHFVLSLFVVCRAGISSVSGNWH